MKKSKEFFGRLRSSRKLRCGGFSVLLTACVAVCVMLLGAVADALESRYALTLDCSFNGVTTQSDTTRAVLSALEKDVHIYAFTSESGENTTLTSLLERYAAASPHVTYSRETVLKSPALIAQYAEAIGDKDVSADGMIVACAESGRARVLTEDDYYVYSYNLDTGRFQSAGFTYEKSLTEAILYVTQDELPTLQLLTGHGELNETDTAVMEETLVKANYQIQRVNLRAGDTLDPGSPLMILSPQYDLSDEELTAIQAFAQAGGDFFIVSQYSDPLNLENYHALLRSYGVSCYPGLVIAQESDTGSYYSDTPVYLMPYMQETDATRTLTAAGRDILLLAGARAFAVSAPLADGLTVSPVLLTGQAYIRNYQDGVSLSDQQPDDPAGVFPVALWADKMFDGGTVSQLFIMGNVTAFTDYWVINNTDSTAFLLQTVRALQGKAPVNLDIVAKNVLRDGLTLGSVTPAAIVAVMLPLLVLLGAVLVLRPRKNL